MDILEWNTVNFYGTLREFPYLLFRQLCFNHK